MTDIIFPLDPSATPSVGDQPVWDGSKWTNQTGGLPKDNTTEFAPDADYEPATKKYVDDAVSDSISNVLELDNTTEFTPDADYEPATKKYVDDNTIAGDGSITKIIKITQAEYNAITPNETTLYLITG